MPWWKGWNRWFRFRSPVLTSPMFSHGPSGQPCALWKGGKQGHARQAVKIFAGHLGCQTPQTLRSPLLLWVITWCPHHPSNKRLEVRSLERTKIRFSAVVPCYWGWGIIGETRSSEHHVLLVGPSALREPWQHNCPSRQQIGRFFPGKSIQPKRKTLTSWH